MIGGVTRRMLPLLSGVPRLQVNRPLLEFHMPWNMPLNIQTSVKFRHFAGLYFQ